MAAPTFWASGKRVERFHLRMLPGLRLQLSPASLNEMEMTFEML
ncbi:rCG25205 [Rattus norvegicus]|uniref:RCG25205 n=1 Tax=Rattus norvegicus TaxID=10116 RepID=A6I1R7_RAT|nr:rCG25205 [Rattus norvegicus]